MSDTEVCLIVKDTGRGIDQAFLPHVFERFRQGDASSTRRHGGLGLGLALVRDLVELHGGAVSAESAGEGTGATFTVRLPTMAVTSVSDDGARAAGPGPRALAGIRVLLIEDELDSRDLARAAMTRFGAEVSAVSSSAQAVHVVLTGIGQRPCRTSSSPTSGCRLKTATSSSSNYGRCHRSAAAVYRR
jgi:hypothetical protein